MKGGYIMSCNCNRSRNNENNNASLIRELSLFIGETVTIFTTSGGISGRGFTGVLISITSDPVVRLLSQFGPAPACALGSCCDKKRGRHCCEDDDDEGDNNNDVFDRFDCNRVRNVGAVVDIPVDKIAAFVHNTL
jgi:hypothetical protein